MRFTQAGLEAYNILNVLCPTAATSADLTAIAGVLQTWWNGTLRPSVPTTLSWQGADLTAMDSPGSPFLAYNNSGTLAGSGVGGLYPPQVTVCVSLRTGLSGRSYRGRLYFIGLGTGNVITGGLITQATATALANNFNTLRTAMVTAGYALCVLSLYSGKDSNGKKIPRAAGIATPVTTIAVGLRVDTQRRRLPVEGRA